MRHVIALVRSPRRSIVTSVGPEPFFPYPESVRVELQTREANIASVDTQRCGDSRKQAGGRLSVSCGCPAPLLTFPPGMPPAYAVVRSRPTNRGLGPWFAGGSSRS